MPSHPNPSIHPNPNLNPNPNPNPNPNANPNPNPNPDPNPIPIPIPNLQACHALYLTLPTSSSMLPCAWSYEVGPC